MPTSLAVSAAGATPRFAVLATAALLLGALQQAAAQVRQVQDTFTATTAGMTPAGITLRLQVLEWSDEAARADVVATLEAADLAALAKLPTVGYVWPVGSPVGYSVKYARKSTPAAGGELITLVTDKPLGSQDYRKWSLEGGAAKTEAGYSVIELTVDSAGNGTGTTSLAADVMLDSAAGTVSLATGGPTLLTPVRRVPAR